MATKPVTAIPVTLLTTQTANPVNLIKEVAVPAGPAVIKPVEAIVRGRVSPGVGDESVVSPLK